MNWKVCMTRFNRRKFLAAGALAAGGALLTTRLTFANAAAKPDSRFVFIILRGALDGLSAVPPHGDPDYARIRRELAIGAPGTAGGAIKLDNLFGLHPKLAFLGDAYAARELAVFHAVASPYRERSHFDGQDVLENGLVRPHASPSGWLNRALSTMPAAGSSARRELGVALGQNVPLVMRGPAAVASWSPSRLAALDEDTLDRITDLYARDALLSKRLADALAANAIATSPNDVTDDDTMIDGATEATKGNAMGDARDVARDVTQDAAKDVAKEGERSRLLAKRDRNNTRVNARYAEVVRASANFLRKDDGPRIAVFDTTGWDTHANEGAAQGQLALRLGALDAGLRTLKEQLGPVWKNTAVLIATEFGRTASTNGTRGTDHGTGAAAFLVGGAVQGGRVITDWPGLSMSALHEGRDLRPTLDLRAVMKSVLADHLGVSTGALASEVFPDSTAARYLPDLIR
jgi:uncharacterized protein (DUF1501 family)